MDKDEFKNMIPLERIENVIYIIRGQKVIFDRDLAILYGTETRVLVQAVKRNRERFPSDFMLQLTKEEMKNWMSQIVISNSNLKMGLRKQPYVFTEQGVAMLSTVLRSPQAILINIEIMRAFIRMRQLLTGQKEMGKELTELKSFLLKHTNHNDREFRRIWGAIEKLSEPQIEREQRKIGFNLK